MYRPILLLCSADDLQAMRPVRVAVDLAVCTWHSRQIPVEALVNDENWLHFEALLVQGGRRMPCRSLTRVGIEPLSVPFDSEGETLPRILRPS